MNQFPELQPELRAYLDAQFRMLLDELADLREQVALREAEYGTTMSAMRIIAQRLGQEDQLELLIESLQQKRRQIAARRKRRLGKDDSLAAFIEKPKKKRGP